MNELNFGAAVLLGLLGGSHCIVMCGGIGAALGASADTSRNQLLTVFLFQIGRIGSYTLLGAGLGALLGLLGADKILPVLRLLSGLLLIAMGCYLANWWYGLRWLENMGARLWKVVQPTTQRLLPVRRYSDALLVGLCWGLLPCGLIYSALAWSATAASASYSAALMFCFGLGTLPLMMATGIAGQRLSRALQKNSLRNGAACILIVMGLWVAGTAMMKVAGINVAGSPEQTGNPHHHH